MRVTELIPCSHGGYRNGVCMKCGLDSKTASFELANLPDVLACPDGPAGTCKTIMPDCCENLTTTCRTDYVPEAGHYCQDGFGCRKGK